MLYLVLLVQMVFALIRVCPPSRRARLRLRANFPGHRVLYQPSTRPNWRLRSSSMVELYTTFLIGGTSNNRKSLHLDHQRYSESMLSTATSSPGNINDSPAESS
jgi:hypothetical protein